MKLNKWNYETHKYDDYIVPDNWNITRYSTDMEEIINCVQCGRKLCVGESYTSMEVHSEIGFGYGVCEECYEKEWKRRKDYETKEN